MGQQMDGVLWLLGDQQTMQ